MLTSKNYQLPSQFLTSKTLEEDINLKIYEKYFDKTVDWFVKEYSFPTSRPAMENFFSHTETIEFLKERKVINIPINRLLRLLGDNDIGVSYLNGIIYRQEVLVKNPIHIFEDLFLSDGTGLTMNYPLYCGHNYLWAVFSFILIHVFMDTLEIPNFKELILLLEGVCLGRESDIINHTFNASYKYTLDCFRNSPCWIVTGVKSVDLDYKGKGYVDVVSYEINEVCTFVINLDNGNNYYVMSTDHELLINWTETESKDARRELVLERVAEQQEKLDKAKADLANMKVVVERMEEDMVWLPAEIEIKLGLNPIFPDKDDKN